MCTVVENTSSNDPRRTIFTTMGDKLYYVSDAQRQIHVHDLSSTDPSKNYDNIDINDVQKPCCFTASTDGYLFLGDEQLNVIFKIDVRERRNATELLATSVGSTETGNNVTVTRWATVPNGEVMSVSALTDGRLAVLTADKYLANKFWRGDLRIFDRNGNSFKKFSVPVQYLLPYCIESVDNDTFVVSYGLSSLSGVAIFRTETDCLKCKSEYRISMWCPVHVLYDKDDGVLLITDAGTKQVLIAKLDQHGMIKAPKILRSWGQPEDLDFATETVRPMRVALAYCGKSTPYKRIVIALQNGQIDMYNYCGGRLTS